MIKAKKDMAQEMLDTILEELCQARKTILLTNGMTPEEIDSYIETKSKEYMARFEDFTLDEVLKDLLESLRKAM